MKLELVEEWRCAWRWISINCMVLAAAIQWAWMYVPADMKASLPSWLVSGLTIGLLVLGVVGRLTKQNPTPAPLDAAVEGSKP